MANNLPAQLRDMAKSEIAGSHREQSLLDAADEIERQQGFIVALRGLVSALRDVVVHFGRALLGKG